MFNQVKWYVSANHAGGYSYRLCKMPERGIKDLTEECFQVNVVVLVIVIREILGNIKMILFSRRHPLNLWVTSSGWFTPIRFFYRQLFFKGN